MCAVGLKERGQKLSKSCQKRVVHTLWGQIFTLSMFPQTPSLVSTSYQTELFCSLNLEQFLTARWPENGSKPDKLKAVASKPISMLLRPQTSRGSGGCKTKEKKIKWSCESIWQMLFGRLNKTSMWKPVSKLTLTNNTSIFMMATVMDAEPSVSALR